VASPRVCCAEGILETAAMVEGMARDVRDDTAFEGACRDSIVRGRLCSIELLVMIEIKSYGGDCIPEVIIQYV